LTCVSSVRFPEKNPVRLDGSFPLVKPIIAAVTSRLLTCPRLPSRHMSVSVSKYIGMVKRDGQGKPQFDYLMWWCYYGRHILMEHYLNTLYPIVQLVTPRRCEKKDRRKRKRIIVSSTQSTSLYSRNDGDGDGDGTFPLPSLLLCFLLSCSVLLFFNRSLRK